MKIRKASKRQHRRILELAKLSPYTKDFGHFMFSGDKAYENGWIRVLTKPGEGPIGFTCVRHKVRQPETSLYFIGIHPDHQREGIGELFLNDLKEQSPNDRITLNVVKENTGAVNFYMKHGFTCVGDSLKGKGHQFTLEW